MKKKLSRQKFLTSAASTGALLFLSPKSFGNPAQNQNLAGQAIHRYFPSQDPELVQEFVAASHGNVEKVKELLATHPELSKAAWDWGFGDWETALGAASHTGNKEIAELLIAKGARPDIFTFTMLGNLNAVKAMIEGNPEFQKIKGPHGITLLAHAKVRLMSKTISEEDKTKAQAMVDYLAALGDTDIKPVNLKTTDEEKKQFIGKYSFGDSSNDVFMIEISKNGGLTIKKEGQKFERPLVKIDENKFTPMGAPHVEIVFEIKDGQAILFNILDPLPILKALKM
jgi:hypothetical protein